MFCIEEEKVGQGPLPSSLVLLRDYVYFLSKFIYLDILRSYLLTSFTSVHPTPQFESLSWRTECSEGLRHAPMWYGQCAPYVSAQSGGPYVFSSYWLLAAAPLWLVSADGSYVDIRVLLLTAKFYGLRLVRLRGLVGPTSIFLDRDI